MVLLKVILKILASVAAYLEREQLLKAGEAKALAKMQEKILKRAKKKNDIKLINPDDLNDSLLDKDNR